MDSNKVNRWLTLGANLGVLIGIILLIVELDQNRDMMRAQTRNELAMGIVEILSVPAIETHIAIIMQRAAAGEELSAVEEIQFSHRTSAMYRYWENVHYQYRMGLYDGVEFSKQRDAWEQFLNTSIGHIKIWCTFRGNASPEFVREVDALLDQGACDST